MYVGEYRMGKCYGRIRVRRKPRVPVAYTSLLGAAKSVTDPSSRQRSAWKGLASNVVLYRKDDPWPPVDSRTLCAMNKVLHGIDHT